MKRNKIDEVRQQKLRETYFLHPKILDQAVALNRQSVFHANRTKTLVRRVEMDCVSMMLVAQM